MPCMTPVWKNVERHVFMPSVLKMFSHPFLFIPPSPLRTRRAIARASFSHAFIVGANRVLAFRCSADSCMRRAVAVQEIIYEKSWRNSAQSSSDSRRQSRRSEHAIGAGHLRTFTCVNSRHAGTRHCGRREAGRARWHFSAFERRFLPYNPPCFYVVDLKSELGSARCLAPSR